MFGKLSKAISLLMTAAMIFSTAACSSATNVPDDPFSSVTLTGTEKTWTNSEDKYSELISTYGTDRFNGVTAVATDDDILYLYCEDDAEKDGTTPVSQNTVFDIASVSKTFTAVSVLQLAEKGKLSLDDTLDKYFPEYETGKSITIYDLLHMRSGIPDYCNDPDPFWNISGAEAANKKLSDIYLDKITDEEFLQALYQAPLNSEPGSENEYSNSNYHILAFIIEKVSGMKYCDYVKKNIFDKCGMKNTTSMAKDDMTYVPVGFDELVEYGFTDENGYPACPNNNRGDGGIHSCVSDMILFDRALFGGRLLNEKSMEIMLEDEDGYCCGLRKQQNGYSHDGSSFTCMANNMMIESEEFGHVYVIRMERTGSVQQAEGDLPDPVIGTSFTKGVYENGFYTNEYAGLKVKIAEEYEQIEEAVLSDISGVLEDCTEEKDILRESATKWDCSFFSIDSVIHDNIHFKYVNTKLASADGKDYTEDDYIDDFITWMELTKAKGYTDEGRETVQLCGKEYVRQVVSGTDSFTSLPEKHLIYARNIDDDLMSVIWIITFYDGASPEDYEKLFE